jgi:hypothetical protein
LPFLLHQDTGIDPYLEAYSRLEPIDAFDVGQDTDFLKLTRMFPDARITCILSPVWIKECPDQIIADSLARIVTETKGTRLPDFALYDIGPDVSDDKIRVLAQITRNCSDSA